MGEITPDLVEWLVADDKVASRWRELAAYLGLSEYILVIELRKSRTRGRTARSDRQKLTDLVTMWRILKKETFTVPYLLRMLDKQGMKDMYEWMRLITGHTLSRIQVEQLVLRQLSSTFRSPSVHSETTGLRRQEFRNPFHSLPTSPRHTPHSSRPASQISISSARNSVSPRRELYKSGAAIRNLPGYRQQMPQLSESCQQMPQLSESCFDADSHPTDNRLSNQCNQHQKSIQQLSSHSRNDPQLHPEDDPFSQTRQHRQLSPSCYRGGPPSENLLQPDNKKMSGVFHKLYKPDELIKPSRRSTEEITSSQWKTTSDRESASWLRKSSNASSRRLTAPDLAVMLYSSPKYPHESRREFGTASPNISHGRFSRNMTGGGQDAVYDRQNYSSAQSSNGRSNTRAGGTNTVPKPPRISIMTAEEQEGNLSRGSLSGSNIDDGHSCRTSYSSNMADTWSLQSETSTLLLIKEVSTESTVRNTFSTSTVVPVKETFTTSSYLPITEFPAKNTSPPVNASSPPRGESAHASNLPVTQTTNSQPVKELPTTSSHPTGAADMSIRKLSSAAVTELNTATTGSSTVKFDLTSTGQPIRKLSTTSRVVPVVHVGHSSTPTSRAFVSSENRKSTRPSQKSAKSSGPTARFTSFIRSICHLKPISMRSSKAYDSFKQTEVRASSQLGASSLQNKSQLYTKEPFCRAKEEDSTPQPSKRDKDLQKVIEDFENETRHLKTTCRTSAAETVKPKNDACDQRFGLQVEKPEALSVNFPRKDISDSTSKPFTAETYFDNLIFLIKAASSSLEI